MNPALISQFDLLLFDFDGTLAHSLPAIATTIRQVFQDCGEPLPSPEIVEPLVGMPLAEIMQRLNPDINQEEAENRATMYRKRYDVNDVEHTTLFPGVEETLTTLREQGFPLVISSNKPQAILERAAERLRVTDFFDSIVGIAPDSPKKPDSGFFTRRIAVKAPQFAAVAPERVLIVGDAWPDLAFAANLGAAGCFAAYGYGNSSECLSYKPKLVIDSFAALVQPS